MSSGEAAVETTVEADLKGDPGRLHRRQRTIGIGQVERHRLLAEDWFSSSSRRDDQIRMSLGRSGDDDGRDLRVVDQLDWIGEGARAVAIGQCLRGLRPGVGDRGCAPGTRSAMIPACEVPIRPAPISPIAAGAAVSTVMIRSFDLGLERASH